MAAFLTCLGGLVRLGLDDALPETTQVVYVLEVSPVSSFFPRSLAKSLPKGSGGLGG